MYNYNLETLFSKIKESGHKNSEKREALNEIKAALDNCVLYMRTSIVTLIQTYVVAWDKASFEDEKLMQEFDGYRNNAHYRCVSACKTLNSICDEYGVEHVIHCDTDDEHGMDEAVGALIAELYKKSSILEAAKKSSI